MNQGQVIPINTTKAPLSVTLMDFLESVAPYFRHLPWQDHLQAGFFRLNGLPANPQSLLRAGDQLLYYRPPWEEPPVPALECFPFEDASLLVLDKPSGIPMSPCGDFFENTVVRQLRQRFPQIAPAHRLDIDTSGLVLLVKKTESRRFYARLFHTDQVTKVYTALCFGHVDPRLKTIEIPLGPAVEGPIFSKQVPRDDGKTARTDVLSVAHVHLEGKPVSQVEVSPKTGRTNQIRAHLAALGHPLVGDKKYFPDPQVFLSWLEDRDDHKACQRVLLPRHALHASRLVLPTERGSTLRIASKTRLKDWPIR